MLTNACRGTKKTFVTKLFIVIQQRTVRNSVTDVLRMNAFGVSSTFEKSCINIKK